MFANSFSFGDIEGNQPNPIKIYDPLKLKKECLANDLPLEPWWGKCNSVTLPLGPEPGIAYFLVDYGTCIKFIRGNYTDGGPLGLSFTFSITDISGTKRYCVYWFVSDYRCLTPGQAQDPNSIYMLTLRDNRAFTSGGSVGSGWFHEIAGSQSNDLFGGTGPRGTGLAFNIPRMKFHRPASSSGTQTWFVNRTVKGTTSGNHHDINFPTTSANDTQTPWTWKEMLTELDAHDMFGYATPADLTLPYTPASTPCDFDFQGTSQYMAVAAVLDRLGMAMRYGAFNHSGTGNSTLGYPRSTIVEVGKDDGILTAALKSIQNYKLFDYDPFDGGNYMTVSGRRKRISYDEPSNSVATSATASWSNPYVGYVYPSFYDATVNQRVEVVNGTYTDGGFGSRMIDHDVPAVTDTISFQGPFSAANDSAWWYEHIGKYKQSILGDRGINRVYSGFHTADKFLPGAMLKIIRWEDTGAGPRTHFYAGDKYLSPHSVYHMVNPHRFIRYDDIERFRHIAGLNLAEL